ncbi:MAG: MBL fold metallo-hydrolase, partial [Alistipes sp.]|nr:MBL fold metallo-hydrolase [Alistipes sp.]
MKIATLTFNPIQENTYVLWDETREAAIVDAGNSNDRENATLDAFIEKHGLRPVLAINTHGHFDHT